MRVSFAIAAALTLGIAAASATEPLRNGAYVSLTTANATACARACADDGICMAWTFRAENACELSAVVPASLPTGALASGFSSRAPGSLRQTTPVPVIEETPAPIETTSTTAEPESELAIAEADMDADAMLLGGPEEGDLRLRLSARR